MEMREPVLVNMYSVRGAGEGGPPTRYRPIMCDSRGWRDGRRGNPTLSPAHTGQTRSSLLEDLGCCAPHRPDPSGTARPSQRQALHALRPGYIADSCTPVMPPSVGE